MSDNDERHSDTPDADATAPANAPATTPAPADDAPQDDDGHFDAVAAAAELDDVLGSTEPAEPVEQHGQSYTDILEAEVADLAALVAEKDAALAAKDAKHAARDAEHEKSRARLDNELDQRLEQRTRKVILGFLEVLDNLDRAIASARATDHNPAVVAGVELVRKSFMAKLATFGVRHDPALGETFDPNEHEAVSLMPTDDPDSDGKVIQVLHDGYSIGDDTLRPAAVVVGKYNG